MAIGNSFNNRLVQGVRADLTGKGIGAIPYSTDANGSLAYLPLGANNTFVGNIGGVLGTYDLVENVHDIVGTLIQDTSIISRTYDDAGNTLSLGIKNNAITFSRIQQIPANSLIGNPTGGTANPTQITFSDLRSILNAAPVLVTTITQTIVAGNKYIANNIAEIVFSLPATAAVGDGFEIYGKKGSGGWRVNQVVAGQSQVVGVFETTPGITAGLVGTVRSGNGEPTSIAEWICTSISPSIEWMVISSLGNLRIDE